MQKLVVLGLLACLLLSQMAFNSEALEEFGATGIHRLPTVAEAPLPQTHHRLSSVGHRGGQRDGQRPAGGRPANATGPPPPPPGATTAATVANA